MPAIRPNALLAPVLVTTITARPFTTIVPAETVSPDPSWSAPPFDAATDSPESADSSTMNAAASSTSASAGTTSPSPISTMSPGTSVAESTVVSFPSRRTRTVGAVSWERAVIARSARNSWVTPTVELATMTMAITAASTKSPVATVNTEAARRTTISGSRSCAPMLDHTDRRPGRRISFRPATTRRSAASALDSPNAAGISVSELTTFALYGSHFAGRDDLGSRRRGVYPNAASPVPGHDPRGCRRRPRNPTRAAKTGDR